MAVREHEQIGELEAYWLALERDPAAVPPAGLDVDLAQTAQRLVSCLRPPEPGTAFVAQLGRQLQAQAAEISPPANPAPAHNCGWSQWLGSLVRSASPVRLATAMAVVAVLVAASFAVTRPQPVNAQVIIQKAQAAATSPATGGVRSFVLTEISRYRLVNGRLDTGGSDGAGDEIISETRRWYQAPDRYRSETEQSALQPDGTQVRRFSLLHVNDGRDVWLYYPDEQRAVVNRPALGAGGVSPEVSPFGQGVGDLNALLEEASTCYEPKVTGNATVAGRLTYVVDLGPTRCPASSGDTGGRRVLWVDQGTFFVLKQELYSTEGDRLIWQSEATSVQYNVPVDGALFSFTPPAGTSVLDGRNQALPTLLPSTPAPGSSPTAGPTADAQQAALLAALEPLAQEADYPLFVPGHIPAGLVPRLPKLQPQEAGGDQLWIEYMPAGKVEQDTMPTLRILEQRPTYESLVTGRNGAVPVAIEAATAWVREDFRADKGGTDSRVLVLRDGTLVTVRSDVLAAEDLLEIASSLQAVPGGHAPLPEPQPPTGAEMPAEPTPAPVLPSPTPMPTPTFRVLRPTWLPEPMTVHERVQGNIVTLGFDPQPGDGLHDVLALYEMPLSLTSGGGSDNLQATREQIGEYMVTVTRDERGCGFYAWDTAGLRLTLSNVYDLQGQPRYTCEQMRKIVESVR